MTSAQDPNQPKTEYTERKVGGGTEINKLLWEVGEKIQARSGELSPDAVYIGSIGIHLYAERKAGGDYNIVQVTQNCLTESVDGANANGALKKAALDISRNYGHELTAKQKKLIKEM